MSLFPICRWQFKTDGFDIGFGVYKRTSDKRQKAKDMDTVLELGRVNSHMVPEDGSVQCMHTGTCKPSCKREATIWEGARISCFILS